MRFQYVQEQEFCDELGKIEPKPRHQMRLLEAVERGCDYRVKRAGAIGLGFVVVPWAGRDWVVWYETNGWSVSLQSIRPDVRTV